MALASILAAHPPQAGQPEAKPTELDAFAQRAIAADVRRST
jgi:hypothetical protein